MRQAPLNPARKASLTSAKNVGATFTEEDGQLRTRTSRESG
jgi:hypothetical protein